MQEPKCSSQGGGASEHGQWGKNEKSHSRKCQGTTNPITTKNEETNCKTKTDFKKGN